MADLDLLTKAARYLADGRVNLRTVLRDTTRTSIVATVRGGHRTPYNVVYSAGRWTCDCDAGAHGSLCCHVTAVALVTDPDGTLTAPAPEPRYVPADVFAIFPGGG